MAYFMAVLRTVVVWISLYTVVTNNLCRAKNEDMSEEFECSTKQKLELEQSFSCSVPPAIKDMKIASKLAEQCRKLQK